MNSVSVISEAVHSGMDLLAALIAYISVKKASEPADDEHKFGHGKMENLAGTIEALLIFFAGLWIIYEAVKKLQGEARVETIGWGVLVMGLSALVNFFVSGYLYRVARETDSIALEADALHLRTDIYTSTGVMAGLVLMYFTGFYWFDPVVAIIVALLIMKAAWELAKNAFFPLLDVRLPVREEKAIKSIINNHASHFIEFHKLRTRKAGSERHIDLHLVVPSNQQVDQAHRLCHLIVDDIERQFPQTQVLIHVEPCEDECTPCNKCKKMREE